MSQNMMVAMILLLNYDDDDMLILLSSQMKTRIEALEILQQRNQQIQLAMQLLANEQASHLGRGYPTGGRQPLPKNIPDITMALINHTLSAAPQVCVQTIGWTAAEFHHLLGFLLTDVNAAENIRGTNFRGCKYNLTGRLFMALYYVKHNSTFANLQFVFSIASSAINVDVYFILDLVLKIFKREMGQLWPDRARRDLIRQMLPANMQGTGVFGIVDSSKVTSLDSTYPVIRRQHYNTHKGFGPNIVVIVDLLGDLLFMESFPVLLDGRGDDWTQYKQTDAFLQQRGIAWDPDETLMGDAKYRGASNVNPNSKNLLAKATATEIAACPVGSPQRQILELYNRSFSTMKSPVEMFIGGSKIRSAMGDSSKCRQKLSTDAGIAHISLLCEYSVFAHAARMRMRGQVHQSNPANLHHGFNGVDPIDRYIRQQTAQLYTQPGRHHAFWGPPFIGLQLCPPALAMSSN